MMRDLFNLRGDLFGFGWLFGVWLAATLGILAWSWFRRGPREALGYLPVLALVGAAIVWVLPALVGEQGLPIRGYGAMLVLAVVSGVWLTAWLGDRMGVDPEIILSMAFWVFLFGILGARLFYVVEYWEDFQGGAPIETLKALANVTEGGLVVYGGAIGGFAAMAGYLWRHKLPALAIADLATPAIGFGLFFGRIGCFLNGCCYGGVTDLPWGVGFPANSPPYVHQVQRGMVGVHGLRFAGPLDDLAEITEVDPNSAAAEAGLKSGQRIIQINDQPIESARQAEGALLKAQPLEPIAVTVAGEFDPIRWTLPAPTAKSLPVHPTQLYSALDGLIIGAFLLAYYPFRKRDGELIAWLFTLYPVTRFLIEMIRDDEGAIAGTGLTISQNVSLALLALAGALWLYLRVQPQGSILPRPVSAAA